jgi:branched-chain amino acid transport system permease protein
LVSSACLAAAAGVAIGFPSLRLRGDYLALATLGFGAIAYSVANNWTDITRGALGLPGIPALPLGFGLSSIAAYLALVAAFALFAYFAMSRIVGSPFGRVLRAIRDDETAALAMGKDVDGHKLAAFAISAFFAGIAGGIYAHYVTYISPVDFTVMESLTIMLMVVFGGLASLKGSLAGASALVLFPEVLRFIGLPSAVAAPLRQMLYGLLLIALILRRPHGLLGRYGIR